MKNQEILETLKRIEAKLDNQAIEPLTFPQAAAYLNLSKSTLYGMTSRSEIVHYKHSKKITFLRSDLDAYLLKNRVATRSEIVEGLSQ